MDKEQEKGGLRKVLNSKWGVGIILVVVVWTWGYMLFGSDSGPSQPQTNNSSSLSIGEEGILNNNAVKTNCEGGAIVATTKENYKEFNKAVVADDRLGYSGMLGRGQLFRVENCTAIKLIGGSFSGMEVRILEGERIGKSGWVAFEFVKRN